MSSTIEEASDKFYKRLLKEIEKLTKRRLKDSREFQQGINEMYLRKKWNKAKGMRKNKRILLNNLKNNVQILENKNNYY